MELQEYVHENSEKIKINVGGVMFKCYVKTLQRFKHSLLARLDKRSEHYDEVDNEYFFDRNPVIFNSILDAYRTGDIHIPKNICGSKFREDLEFWGLSDQLVSECCWETLYSSEETVQTIEILKQFYDSGSDPEVCDKLGKLKQHLWLFLHEPKSSKLAKIWGCFISFIIILSVVISAIETVPAVHTGTLTERENVTFNKILQILQGDDVNNTRFSQILFRKPNFLVYTIDAFCFAILSAEMVLVFALSPNRTSLMKCWQHVSEVICSLAFWIFFVCESNLEYIESPVILRVMIACKYLTILKLVRLFRIARNFTALKIMGLTIKLSKYELHMMALLLFMLTSLFGTTVYMTEIFSNDIFDNIFTGMYWALITLTTVGYGDYAPNTTFGQIVATVCSVSGVMMLVLPIGIFASNFNNLYHHNQYVSKRVEAKLCEPHNGERSKTTDRQLKTTL